MNHTEKNPFNLHLYSNIQIFYVCVCPEKTEKKEILTNGRQRCGNSTTCTDLKPCQFEWGRNAERMLLLTWKSSAVSVKCRVYMRLPSVQDEGMSLHIRAKWKTKQNIYINRKKPPWPLFAFFSVFGLSCTFYLVALFYFPKSLRTHQHTFILMPIRWKMWKNNGLHLLENPLFHWIWLWYRQQA